MKIIKKYFILLIFLISSLSHSISYPYKVPGNDEEYFLNPLVNYSFTFENEDKRNNTIYTNSFIKLSYGSLLNYQLLKDEELVLNLPLNEQLAFSANYRNYETRHLSYDTEEFKIGLKYKINSISLVGETQIESGKDLVDVGAGILLQDSENNYLSAKITFDDFIFDMKNTNDGSNNLLPLTILTNVNYSNSFIYLFAEVNYSTGFDREFSVDESISDVNYHQLQNCEYRADIKFRINKKLDLYSKVFFNKFKEEKKFNDLDSSYYRMESDFFSIELGMNQKFDRSALKYGVIYAESNQDKIGDYPTDYFYRPEKSYSFKVSAFIPYLFYTLEWNENLQIEPGMLVQINQDNDYITPWKETYLLHLEYNDMLKLGVRYKFDDRSFIYVSMGHLFNSGKFGGGNVRFVKYF